MARSASFRLPQKSRNDLTLDSSRLEIFKTPCSTPRKIRRSISTGDLSVVLSPVVRSKKIVQTEKKSRDELEKRNLDLEQKLKETLEKLRSAESKKLVICDHEDMNAELTARIEQLEIELNVAKVELRIREDEEKKEKLTDQLDNLRLQNDIAS